MLSQLVHDKQSLQPHDCDGRLPWLMSNRLSMLHRLHTSVHHTPTRTFVELLLDLL